MTEYQSNMDHESYQEPMQCKPTFNLKPNIICAPNLVRAIAYWLTEDYDLTAYYARKAFNQHPDHPANLSDDKIQAMFKLAKEMETDHRDQAVKQHRKLET